MGGLNTAKFIALIFVGLPSLACKQNPAQLADGPIFGTDAVYIPVEKVTTPRPVSAQDLVDLRDIGGGGGAMSVSPDGQSVAFHLQQADPYTNTFSTGWFVAPARPGANPINVGDGGDVMLIGEESGLINGTRQTMHAKWSLDSEWIAYRLKRNGETQLWRSRRDGSVQEQLTRNAADVSSFEWSEDGALLFFEVGASRAAYARARSEESAEGFLFDDRFQPFYSTAPIFVDPAKWNPFAVKEANGLWVYDLGDRSERPATDEEHAAFETVRKSPKPEGVSEDRDIRTSKMFSAGGRLA